MMKILLVQVKKGFKEQLILQKKLFLRKINISFEIFCRSDSFNGNEEAVRILSEAGLTSALVGLESGYQKGLNSFSKGTTVKQNLNTIELFSKYNIITSSSGFLMFNPYSTFKELEENAKFLLSIKMATLYNMSLKILGYPGIRLVETLKEEGMLNDDFGYLNVSGYKFKDSRISRLVMAINFDKTLIIKEDTSHRYVDYMLTRIDRQLSKIKLTDNQENVQIKLKINVNNLRLRANLVTYNFFIKAVILFENNWETKKIERVKNDYIYDISKAIEAMNDGFTEYLDFLNQIL